MQSKQEPLFDQKQKATFGKNVTGKKTFFLLVHNLANTRKDVGSVREPFKKGRGRAQVIYLKMSVSDNDVTLSSTSRPASLWDKGMSRTRPDTRLGDKLFSLSVLHAVVMSKKKKIIIKAVYCSVKETF